MRNRCSAPSPPTVWSVTDPTRSLSDRHRIVINVVLTTTGRHGELVRQRRPSGGAIRAQSPPFLFRGAARDAQESRLGGQRGRRHAHGGDRPGPARSAAARHRGPDGKDRLRVGASRHSASERQPYSALARPITLAGRDIAHRLRFRSRGWGPCEMVHMPVPTATTCTRQGPATEATSKALTRGLAKDVTSRDDRFGQHPSSPIGGLPEQSRRTRGGRPRWAPTWWSWTSARTQVVVHHNADLPDGRRSPTPGELPAARRPWTRRSPRRSHGGQHRDQEHHPSSPLQVPRTAVVGRRWRALVGERGVAELASSSRPGQSGSPRRRAVAVHSEIPTAWLAVPDYAAADAIRRRSSRAHALRPPTWPARTSASSRRSLAATVVVNAWTVDVTTEMKTPVAASASTGSHQRA